MRIALSSALAALALTVFAGAPAQAEAAPAAATLAAGFAVDGEIGVHINADGAAFSFISQPGRHGYRGRDRGYRGYRGRHHRGYRGRNHRPRYGHRGYNRPAYRARCWTEQRYSHYRGRPAYVSVRLCRDRYGRAYVQRGSERLVYYVNPRGHRYRHGRRW